MAGAEFKKGYNKGFEDGANSVEEGLPGWFGTFADMMTLLFAFFVLLAAISTNFLTDTISPDAIT